MRLIAAGPALVHFAVEVPAPEYHPAADSLEGARLALAGYEARGLPGEAELPLRVLAVAVPPHGEVRVESAAVGVRVEDGVRLAALPGAPEAARAGEAAGAWQPVRLLDVSWMRDQRVARLAVSPARYDAASRRLRLCERIDVRVSVTLDAEAAAPVDDPDPFEAAYREVLVNYEQGRAWRRARADAGGARLEAATVAAAGPTFPGRGWIKIEVSATGFYKVDFGQIRNLEPFAGDTTTALDSLRLVTWPGYPVLPEKNYCDSCGYREVAIGLIDNGDGRFNRNSDAIYFFALGPSDWADLYDPDRPETLHVNNPYEKRSFYYLTVSDASNPLPGPFRRIVTEDASPHPGGGEIVPATFTAREHFEQDLAANYFPHVPALGSTMFWEKWFWQSLSLNGTFATQVDAPGVDTTQAARVRARVWGGMLGRTGVCHAVDVEVGQTSLGRFGWYDQAFFTVDPVYPVYVTGFTVDAAFTGLGPQGNSVRISIPTAPPCNNISDRIGVAWIDFFYPRRFEPVDDELSFDSAPGAADYLYRVEPFVSASPPRVFDVTDSYAPREMIGFLYDTAGGAYRLSMQAAQSDRRRFRIIQDASIVKVPTATLSSTPAASRMDLRGSDLRADYLLIYYDGFKAAADTLAAWREAHDGFEVMSVPVSALYDQFSGGRTDPAAIRNFLRAVFRNWEKRPAYVTLLGDASFDFKNYKGRALPGQPGTLLPTYENSFDPSPQIYRQFTTDDWLLNVDTAAVVVPDFLGGRIPAGDPTTALSVVRNKVLLYERNAPFDEYRNRVMLIADDNMVNGDPDQLGWTHMQQTAELDAEATPLHMDRAYVYLHTYPDGPGFTKPQARADITANLNDVGVAMFNYIGHGSPFQMSDERVFLDTDVGTLVNGTRLPVFVAASCDVGKFNDPTVPSLGERLLVRVGGGAIAVISATEEAYSGQNAALNRQLYRSIFTRDASGHYYVTLSEALLAGKFGSTNSQKYQLMGDAATRLNLPREWVELSVWDSTGTQPLTEIDHGQTIMVRGEVLDRPGGVRDSLSGVASLLIEDSAPVDVLPDCTPIGNCMYRFKAGPIYRGDLLVSGGAFEGRLVVPLEARLGPRGRLRAYVTGRQGGVGAETDGAGAKEVPVGQGSASPEDNEGPRITLSFAGGATSVRPNAVLRVLLYDPSGILITNHVPQNGIIVTVDRDATGRSDITPSFRYAAGSYQSGTATFQLPGLPEGPHNIRVSAADNLAVGLSAGIHRSSASIDFEVAETPRLDITNAYLFPNPTRSGGGLGGGHFVVDAPGDSVNVLLRIYTVSGRLVRVLKAFGGLGQTQLPWDGLDAEGQKLANGVYLFKVHVNAREADGSSSPREKASAQGKFIISNP